MITISPWIKIRAGGNEDTFPASLIPMHEYSPESANVVFVILMTLVLDMSEYSSVMFICSLRFVGEPLKYHAIEGAGKPLIMHVNCKVSVLVTFVSSGGLRITGATTGKNTCMIQTRMSMCTYH